MADRPNLRRQRSGTQRPDLGRDVMGRVTGMSSIKVAAICPRMALCDPYVNLKSVETWCVKAKDAGANLAVFPEIFITGYIEPFTGESKRPLL